MIEELAQKCWESRTYGPAWFNYTKFAKLVAMECMESCVKIEDTYLNVRLGSIDTNYKTQLAEGETACALVAKDIKDKFFK